MNKQPIEQARDADLRLSHAALRRAGLRAREIARQTGTAIVVSRHGVIEYLHPQPELGSTAQEPIPPYGDPR
ncbi:hypothetical protein [Accumulibacter sp.]|uniref:hypothetical protein n=1 Tax=Accumulibacter sp. TaxID=2053492 RepID=UPI0028C3B05F|nr:hypothetical protein [Accumulibacter sp.]